MGWNSGTGWALTHLTLPSVNEPATPTLTIGNGGFYSAANNQMQLAFNGSLSITWGPSGNAFSSNASGWQTAGGAASATTATLVPNRSDTNSGVGGAGGDQLTLISGGVERARFMINDTELNIVCVDDAVVCIGDAVVFV